MLLGAKFCVGESSTKNYHYFQILIIASSRKTDYRDNDNFYISPNLIVYCLTGHMTNLFIMPKESPWYFLWLIATSPQSELAQPASRLLYVWSPAPWLRMYLPAMKHARWPVSIKWSLLF